VKKEDREPEASQARVDFSHKKNLERKKDQKSIRKRTKYFKHSGGCPQLERATDMGHVNWLSVPMKLVLNVGETSDFLVEEEQKIEYSFGSHRRLRRRAGVGFPSRASNP